MKIGNFCLLFSTKELVSQLTNNNFFEKKIKRNAKQQRNRVNFKCCSPQRTQNLFLFSREILQSGLVFTKRNNNTFLAYGPICLKHKTSISKNTPNNYNHGKYFGVLVQTEFNFVASHFEIHFISKVIRVSS